MKIRQFWIIQSADRLRWSILLTICALIFQGPQSHAEQLSAPIAALPPSGPAVAQASSGSLSNAADAEFFDLLSRGLAHYDSHRYREAIKDLQQAYAIHSFPRILQNIGSAHRKLGEYHEARQFLSLYLALEPSLATDKRRRIEQILVALERKIVEQRQSSIPPSRPRWRMGFGVGVGLVGALVLGFGIPALAVDGRCIQAPSLPGEVCPRQYDTRTLGAALTVSGGALSLGGLLLAIWPVSHNEGRAAGRGLATPRQSLLLFSGSGRTFSVN